MKLKTIGLVATVAVLSACVKPVEVTQPPATMALKNANFAQRVVAYREPVLRTYTKVDGKQSEVSGLRCVLDSAELKATVITPVVVRVPTFKGKPTALRISCEGGALAGETVINPQISGTAVGGASAAGLVAAVVSTAIIASRDQWNFGADGQPMSVIVK